MENFIVSARKYRPQTFASVVGQSHITSTLKNAIERGQLAHAYLFCGPRGVGKTTCARIFAKSINCLNPNGSEACGVCESCTGFESGRSMNIHELDAASNNSVEDIRSLIEQVRIIPQVGKYALFIIDEVHMLSTAAFNAFLKTLEEPPAHAIFILATTERHKILPTILSRCQCYDFNRIRVEDGAEYLRYIAQSENITIDDESLNLIAQKADGGMRDALSMFDKAVSFGGAQLDYRVVAQSLGVVDYDTYFRITDALLEGNYGGALVLFDEVLGMGFGVASFLSGLARHLRDLLVSRDDKTRYLMELTESMMNRYHDQGQRSSVEFLFGAIGVLTSIDSELKRSSSQRLLVELGLMKISSLGQKKNIVSGITDRMSAFDAKLPKLVKEAAVERVVEREPEKEVAVAAPEGVAAKEAAKETVKEVAKETVVEVTDVEPQKEQVAAIPQKRARATTKLFDLSNALARGGESEVAEDAINEQGPRLDPKAEEKLNAIKTTFLRQLESSRPRFIAFFTEMQITGNRVAIEVPTEELKLEIRKGETQLLTQLVEMAGIDGIVELDITVKQLVKAKRPIKLEDRIAHFTKLNPAIVELTNELDMQVDG